MKLSRLPFFLPFMAMWFADVVATLAGQPAAYWLGDYSQTNELNPLFRPLLAIGPWAFVLTAIACLAVLAVVVRRLNVRMATSTLFLATVIHLFGAATWIVQIPRYGILLVVILGLAVKIQIERDWRRLAAIRSTAPLNQQTGPVRRDPSGTPSEECQARQPW